MTDLGVVDLLRELQSLVERFDLGSATAIVAEPDGVELRLTWLRGGRLEIVRDVGGEVVSFSRLSPEEIGL